MAEIEDKSWFVSVIGPDEIHGPYTEIEALREANGLNMISEKWNRDKSHDEMVISWAIVEHKSQISEVDHL